MNRALAIGVVVLSAGAIAPGATAASKSTTVTPSDNGRTVTVARGARLIISLKDNNPSTGYSWSYTRKPSGKVLTFVSDRTAAPTVSGAMGMVGAPQARTIVYRARAKGTTHLRLVYLPPGRGTKAAATLALTVRVK
jgi:predicted secreted protein